MQFQYLFYSGLFCFLTMASLNPHVSSARILGESVLAFAAINFWELSMRENRAALDGRDEKGKGA